MTRSHQIQNRIGKWPVLLLGQGCFKQVCPLILSLPFSLPIDTGHMEGSPKKLVEAEVLRWKGAGRWIRAPRPIYTRLTWARNQKAESRVWGHGVMGSWRLCWESEIWAAFSVSPSRHLGRRRHFQHEAWEQECASEFREQPRSLCAQRGVNRRRTAGEEVGSLGRAMLAIVRMLAFTLAKCGVFTGSWRRDNMAWFIFWNDGSGSHVKSGVAGNDGSRDTTSGERIAVTKTRCGRWWQLRWWQGWNKDVPCQSASRVGCGLWGDRS